jgi:hypothetical protein
LLHLSVSRTKHVRRTLRRRLSCSNSPLLQAARFIIIQSMVNLLKEIGKGGVCQAGRSPPIHLSLLMQSRWSPAPGWQECAGAICHSGPLRTNASDYHLSSEPKNGYRLGCVHMAHVCSRAAGGCAPRDLPDFSLLLRLKPPRWTTLSSFSPIIASTRSVAPRHPFKSSSRHGSNFVLFNIRPAAAELMMRGVFSSLISKLIF